MRISTAARTAPSTLRMPGASKSGIARARLLVSVAALGALAAPTAALAQQAPIVLDTVTLESGASDGGTGTSDDGTTSAGGLTTKGYVAKSSATATKTDTPLVKVPQSVSTVTRKQLDDRNVQSLTEALTYTPGVRVGSAGFDPRFDSFTIRGFDVTYSGVYRDGLKQGTGNFAIFKHEPYGLEGVTVLKGPSSAVYGSGSPGGVVDLVSKRPTEKAFYEVEAQLGTNDRRQAQFDAGGPIDADGNFLYRLTGLFRESDTDLLSNPDDRAYIAPAFTLRSDDRNTTFTFLGEYSDSKTGGNSVYFNENGRITDIESGDPAYGDFDQEQGRAGYEFEHRFNDTFTVRQNFRYAHIDADVKYTQIDSLSEDRLTANRSAWRITDDLDTIAVDNQAQANFSTGPIEHTFLGGLDYTWVDITDKIGARFDAPPLDLSTRNYGDQPIAGPESYNFADGRTRQDQTGLYAQDQMEYDGFILTAGGRYDWVTTENFDYLADTESSQDDEKFTGRVGLSYLFDIGLAPYVSYSTSFAPTIGREFGGNPFKPTTAEQQEIGIKYAPEDSNVTASAALFRIDQENGLAPDPDNLNFQVQRGKIRAEGFELEATAGFDNGLSFNAAYTYLNLEIVAGTNAGNRPSAIPEHQASLWANYAFQGGVAEGLELGAGLRYLGKSFGDDANTFENDARVLVDAAVRYDFSAINPDLAGLQAKVNAKNLFDKRDATCQAGYCYRDEGRSVIGSLAYRF